MVWPKHSKEGPINPVIVPGALVHEFRAQDVPIDRSDNEVSEEILPSALWNLERTSYVKSRENQHATLSVPVTTRASWAFCSRCLGYHMIFGLGKSQVLGAISPEEGFVRQTSCSCQVLNTYCEITTYLPCCTLTQTSCSVIGKLVGSRVDSPVKCLGKGPDGENKNKKNRKTRERGTRGYSTNRRQWLSGYGGVDRKKKSGKEWCSYRFTTSLYAEQP